MHRSILPILLLLGVSSLTACKTTEWVKPGISSSVRSQDLAICKADAYHGAPVELAVATIPGHRAQGLETCKTHGGKKECSHDSTWVASEDKEIDRNDDARDALIEDCMYRHGYAKERAFHGLL